jgi:hypothetical protein
MHTNRYIDRYNSATASTTFDPKHGLTVRSNDPEKNFSLPVQSCGDSCKELVAFFTEHGFLTTPGMEFTLSQAQAGEFFEKAGEVFNTTFH